MIYYIDILWIRRDRIRDFSVVLFLNIIPIIFIKGFEAGTDIKIIAYFVRFMCGKGGTKLNKKMNYG